MWGVVDMGKPGKVERVKGFCSRISLQQPKNG